MIGGAGAVLPLRLRAALAIGTSFVVSLIGTAFAGPVFHLVDHGLGGLWAMAWLYSAGILLIGTGLHTFLKRWTTLGVMAALRDAQLHVAPAASSGPRCSTASSRPCTPSGTARASSEGTRSHVYFGGHGLGGHLWTLVWWLVAGLLLVGVAAPAEKRRRTAEAEAAANAAAVAAAAVAATVPEPTSERDGRTTVRGGAGREGEQATEARERAADVDEAAEADVRDGDWTEAVGACGRGRVCGRAWFGGSRSGGR